MLHACFARTTYSMVDGAAAALAAATNGPTTPLRNLLALQHTQATHMNNCSNPLPPTYMIMIVRKPKHATKTLNTLFGFNT